MKEQEPERDPAQEAKNNKLTKDINDFFKRHRLWRYPANIAWRISVYTVLISTKDGRERLKNPETRRFLYDREAQAGLLEGSIFNHDLFHPNEEERSLLHEHAVAGRWVAYDFNRPQEFGQKVKKRGRQIFTGKLIAFPLDEIIDNKLEDHTSTYLLNPYAIEHVLQMDTSPKIDDLLSYGFIEESTYRQSFESVGQYETYKSYMSLAGITEERVYRVTPKGNTLVYIERDFGDKRKDPDRKTVLKPAFGFTG
ncbi:MAG: hypothetical protein HYT08_00500 [Candidatus Levybacteria bacterium]|nr:hypothetical protein [Candidatus Levybacteria bacterium]